MSRAANIDNFVKGGMSGLPLQQFQTEMRGNPILAQEVENQQMVLDLVNRQGNSDLRAEIQQVRSTYENQTQISARKVDRVSKPVLEETKIVQPETTSIIKVILHLDGYKTEVQHIQMKFKQEVDQNGQPSSIVLGARIYLTLPVQKNSLIWSWMIDSSKKLNGKLSYIGSNGKECKHIEFIDAYCVAYQLKYDAFNNKQVKQNIVEKITIIPKEVHFRGISNRQ